MNKRAQVSIYVIVAIVLVSGIAIFFAFRSGVFSSGIPVELQPVYSYYDSCVADSLQTSIDLAQTRGGFVELDNYEEGSAYSPFGNQLNFFGAAVPYWFYQTGNGLIEENVPTRSGLESDIENYIEQELQNCDLGIFEEQGFSIERGNPNVNVDVLDNKVDVNVRERISVSKNEVSATRTNSEISIDSKLGKFLGLALDIYENQRSNMFLEDYSIDTLNLNAPVDGVLSQCNSEVWETSEVAGNIRSSLESNIGALKLSGNYYTLSNKENEYFVLDQETDEEVNFIYLSEVFPSKIEITPAEDEFLIANPLGEELGLGALGFCYVPYHFVYDVSYPVLIQIRDGSEIFQFPLVVIIDNNVPRIANLTNLDFEETSDVDICEFKNKVIDISTYDVYLEPVEADVSYRCFDQVCDLGKTSISGGDSNLLADIPTCLNGQIIVEAEGYKTQTQTYSSNSETISDVILDKEYELNVDFNNGGIINFEGTAIVSFDDGQDVRTFVYPGNGKMTLSQGYYNVTAYVYGETSLVFPASIRTECVDVPQSGLFGLFNSNKEECFNVETPETILDSALVGGGRAEIFIFDSDLEKGRMTISTSALPSPRSIVDLQKNYELFEGQNVEVSFG